MKHVKSFSGLFLTVLLLLTFLTSTGCKKNDSVNVDDPIIEAEATQDAAEAIAASVAIDNGGAMEVVGDMLDVSTVGGLVASANDGNAQLNSAQREYDSTTGWWTVTINRQRSNPSGLNYATYQRVTKHQFLNKNGIFQKNYVVGADTAYTINHEIISGSAAVHTPRVSHRLLSLTGKWIATNTNKSIVTVNTVSGFPFMKTGADTVTRLGTGAVRTLNCSLTLNFANVTGPRVNRINWHQAASGTITGHYHAEVTFTSGATYREKTIDRDITITLGGEKIKIKVGSTSFDANAQTGEVY